MRREDFFDESGQTFARYRLRVQHWIPLAPESRVEHPYPARYALSKAIEETVDVSRFILVLLVRVAQAHPTLGHTHQQNKDKSGRDSNA